MVMKRRRRSVDLHVILVMHRSLLTSHEKLHVLAEADRQLAGSPQSPHGFKDTDTFDH